MDRWLDAASQIAVSAAEALCMYLGGDAVGGRELAVESQRPGSGERPHIGRQDLRPGLEHEI